MLSVALTYKENLYLPALQIPAVEKNYSFKLVFRSSRFANNSLVFIFGIKVKKV